LMIIARREKSTRFSSEFPFLRGDLKDARARAVKLIFMVKHWERNG